MELENFIKNFADCFENADENEFSAGTVYRELDEWSSMSALAVIAMVDENYGKALKAADFRAATTIEDLFNLIKAK